jgi:hypothetical protein
MRELFARRHAVVAIVLYLVGAVVMQHHAVAHMGTEIAGNLVGDPTQYMWSMWWWPHAILHGINPFVTHDIWVPDTYNLGSVTSTPLPSLLFAPVTALLGPVQGPVVDYNLCNLIAPGLSAWFVYRLCLYLTQAPGPSIVGGWLFGFSTYALSQLQGHMHLVFTFLPPVLLLLSLQRMDCVISRRRYVVLGATALVADILIGTEIVFTTTCMLAVTVVASVILVPRATRARILALLPELFGAYVLAAVVCAPFLYYALNGPEVEANYNSVLKVADLLSFAIPTALTWIGGHKFAAISAGFPPASHLETGTYLGLPVIIGALIFSVRSWRSPATKVLVVVTFIAGLWALGPSLIIDGHVTISLPWKLLEYKHPFNEVTPVRIGIFVALGTAIAFARWMALPKQPAVRRWILALLAVVFLAPNIDGTYPSGTKIFREGLQSPAFITTGLYRHYLRRGEVILPVPFGPFGNSLLWQAQAQGYFRLASGWFGYWPPDYGTSVLIQQLSSFHSFTDPVSGTRSFLLTHDVGAVVMLSGQAGPWPRVMSQLGLRRISVGGVWLYQVSGIAQPSLTRPQ